MDTFYKRFHRFPSKFFAFPGIMRAWLRLFCSGHKQVSVLSLENRHLQLISTDLSILTTFLRHFLSASLFCYVGSHLFTCSNLLSGYLFNSHLINHRTAFWILLLWTGEPPQNYNACCYGETTRIEFVEQTAYKSILKGHSHGAIESMIIAQSRTVWDININWCYQRSNQGLIGPVVLQFVLENLLLSCWMRNISTESLLRVEVSLEFSINLLRRISLQRDSWASRTSFRSISDSILLIN